MKKFILFTLMLLCITAAAMAAETTYTGVCSPITVNTPGEHTVILDGVTIDNLDTTAISVKAPATKLTIILKNSTHSTLYAAPEDAAIANNGATVVIRCESAGEGHVCDEHCGSLYAYGRSGGAGIGSGYYTEMTGSVVIEGGNLEIAASYGGAGIGSGEHCDMLGDIVINGGNLKITGGKEAAGIGGGAYANMSGTVTINGGNVNITGGDGGIGGGSLGNLTGSVYINGGNVNITGGHGSAGIGGGSLGNLTGSVYINGGNVNITGGYGGAAIGGGYLGNLFSGNVTITGGEVIATGSEGAAGIGTGSDRSAYHALSEMSGNVTITGGKIIARSFLSAGGEVAASVPPAIGADVLTGTITITGGEVTAIAEETMAIGFSINRHSTGKLIIDPAAGTMIKGEAARSKEEAIPFEGSPFSKKAEILSLLNERLYSVYSPDLGKTVTVLRPTSYAHFVSVPIPATPIPSPTPAPEVPKTGDQTNFALLSVLALMGVMGMALVLRSKRKA